MRGRQSSTSCWPHPVIWLRRHLTLSLFSSGCQSMLFFLLFSFSKMMPLVYAEYVCIEHNMSWIAATGTVILWIKSAIFSVVMQVGTLRLYRKCRNCRLTHVATFISLFSWSCHIMIKYYLVHFWKEKKRKEKTYKKTWGIHRVQSAKGNIVCWVMWLLRDDDKRRETIQSISILVTLSHFHVLKRVRAINSSKILVQSLDKTTSAVGVRDAINVLNTLISCMDFTTTHCWCLLKAKWEGEDETIRKQPYNKTEQQKTKTKQERVLLVFGFWLKHRENRVSGAHWRLTGGLQRRST